MKVYILFCLVLSCQVHGVPENSTPAGLLCAQSKIYVASHLFTYFYFLWMYQVSFDPTLSKTPYLHVAHCSFVYLLPSVVQKSFSIFSTLSKR